MKPFSRSSNFRRLIPPKPGTAVKLGVTALCAISMMAQPVLADSIPLVRDTEVERLLRSYEDPILHAAGLEPAAVKMYLVQDSSLNAFAAEGQNIFVNTGLIQQLHSPNEVTGVLAHETGHIAGGHLIRDTAAVSKAMVPMLVGVAAGVAAMIAGAGEGGMAIMGLGMSAGQAQFMQFSRVQEATADQMGQKFLRETDQSGRGMLDVFERMADEEAMSAYKVDPLAMDHPADRDRIDLLQRIVDSSPYKDVKDTPAAMHAFHMAQAKLAGFLDAVDMVLTRYPTTDSSEEAHYARAVAYFRQPDLQKALAECDTLLKLEPNNPYFWELEGQIYVDMSKPERGVPAYQKSVDLMPDAPLLRVSLAAAQLATEKSVLAKPALDNLKVALRQENDNTFAWFEAAQAYSEMGNEPMANLSTAERYYNAGAMPAAAHFAMIAQKKLPQGSPDWQRATDIMAVAGPEAQKHH
ncbi:MAG TPA: M48 family metalloprotease [Rhizomicrobium sp.]|nr:M48 family metalloprotease [Rhizomicrobium sp.]